MIKRSIISVFLSIALLSPCFSLNSNDVHLQIAHQQQKAGKSCWNHRMFQIGAVCTFIMMGVGLIVMPVLYQAKVDEQATQLDTRRFVMSAINGMVPDSNCNAKNDTIDLNAPFHKSAKQVQSGVQCLQHQNDELWNINNDVKAENVLLAANNTSIAKENTKLKEEKNELNTTLTNLNTTLASLNATLTIANSDLNTTSTRYSAVCPAIPSTALTQADCIKSSKIGTAQAFNATQTITVGAAVIKSIAVSSCEDSLGKNLKIYGLHSTSVDIPANTVLSCALYTKCDNPLNQPITGMTEVFVCTAKITTYNANGQHKMIVLNKALLTPTVATVATVAIHCTNDDAFCINEIQIATQSTQNILLNADNTAKYCEKKSAGGTMVNHIVEAFDVSTITGDANKTIYKDDILVCNSALRDTCTKSDGITKFTATDIFKACVAKLNNGKNYFVLIKSAALSTFSHVSTLV